LDKAKPLGQVLHEQGALGADRRTLLEALVAEHLKQHDNDPQRSLASLSSVSSTKRHLARIEDADVQASLIHISKPRGESPAGSGEGDDPFATISAADKSTGRFVVL